MNTNFEWVLRTRRANAPRYQKISNYDKNLRKRVLGSAGDLSLKPGMFTKIQKYFGRGAVKGGREGLK